MNDRVNRLRRWACGRLRRAVLALGLAVGFWAAPGLATEGEVYFARSWQVEDGLPENSVLGVAQTPDGFLWVATHQGLLRFDGIRFQDFPAVVAAGRPTAYLETLMADGKGRLWMAKNRGVVVCVEGDRVTPYTVSEAREDFKATSMAQDGEGAIWISYQKGQPICRIKDDRVETFGANEGVSSSSVHWLAADRSGRLWFSRAGALGLFRSGRFQVVLRTPDVTLRIAAAREGGLWAGAGVQVWRYQEGGELVPVARLGPGHGAISRLFEDRNGRLWVGTDGGRLFWLDGAALVDTGLEGADILSLTDDREGNLWVGTRVAGLNRIRAQTLQLLGRESGWNFGRVQSVCVDVAGVMWAVGAQHRLARYEAGGWILQLTNSAGTALKPTCVAADPQGGVYLGTVSDGLWHSTNDSFYAVTNNTPLRERLIRALQVTSDGGVWLGQESPRRLRRWRAGVITDFELPPGKHAPRAFAEDAQQTVWAATSDGALVRVTGDQLSDETGRTLPEAPAIRSLYCTADGSLWIGYAERGLGRMKAGRFFLFERQHGLPEPYVSQILADAVGRLWLAGNRGVSCVSLAELDAVAEGRAARFVPMTFGRDEGLPRLEASFDIWPNAARDGLGDLIFSTPAGLLRARPDAVFQSPEPPPVALERVTANGRLVAAYFQPGSAGSNGPPVVSLRGMTNRIRLGPGRQQVEIEFTALRLAAPENVQFRYRLEGRDSAWVDVGTHRRVRFERLSPGEYRFEATAANHEGEWNETGAAVAISVLPHFWETRWFWAGAGTVFLVGVGGAARMIERRRMRQQLERLEREHAVERERTRIAKDLHDDLGASLTQIAMLSHFAQSPAVPAEQARADIQKVGGMAREMTRSLAEIVWAVNPRNDSLESFVSYACHLAEESLRAAGIRCLLDTDADLPRRELDTELRHNLLMVVKEAINNVIKHSGAKVVWVRVKAEPPGFRLVIEDDGRGFDLDQSATGRAPDGSGNGLTNIRKRIESIGGQFTITSRVGAGTRLEIVMSLPVAGA